MQLERTYYHKLTSQEKRRLRQLTLQKSWGGSMMYEALDELRDGGVRSRDVPLVLARMDNKIVGWGLLRIEDYSGKRVMMIYVMPTYRRRGIGRAIAMKLKRFQGHRCIVWDKTSKKFYSHVKVKSVYSYY